MPALTVRDTQKFEARSWPVLTATERAAALDLWRPLLDAVSAASVTPARTLGLTGVGSLAAGQRADVVVVDDDLELTRVMRRGRWLAPDVPDSDR